MNSVEIFAWGIGIKGDGAVGVVAAVLALLLLLGFLFIRQRPHDKDGP